jgi:hypothetical protein
MMTSRVSTHEQSWLQLPWLANGRLAGAERATVEAHVAGCAECAQELSRQRLLCEALAEPDRVTYAPGPSFRKLMERIDGQPAVARPARAAPAATPARGTVTVAAAWRPPGLAWAATFVMALGLAVLAPAAYHWSQKSYTTYLDNVAPTPGVLHVAFERSLPLGDLEELLRADGAHVVEGPDASGVFGVAPLTAGTGDTGVTTEMRTLAARLSADGRVRWVQPLPGAQGSHNGGP